MAIITFTSDFGTRDHYVAAVKAKIFNYNPTIQIIDISHSIEQFDIAQGAFVLNSVFREFPKGTVHLVSVNSLNRSEDKFIAIKLEDHFFVGSDNGLFSLLSDKTPVIVELNYDKNANMTFPEKNIMAFAAVSLASGKNIYDLGVNQFNTELKKLHSRIVHAHRGIIEGNVIHVDSYGNVITNITKKIFDENWQNRAYTITFGRQEFDQMNKVYNEVDTGDCAILFNDLGLMEIAINNGSASQLLNLHFDTPVKVIFNSEK